MAEMADPTGLVNAVPRDSKVGVGGGVPMGAERPANMCFLQGGLST